jgi:hypothetical protein
VVSSWPPGGAIISRFDGSVRQLLPGISEQTFRIAITPDDNQVLPRDWWEG